MNTSQGDFRIVEIVGLAGAGKSTLTSELCSGCYGVIQGVDFDTPSLRYQMKYASYCLRQIVCLLPLWSRLGMACRELTHEEVKKLIYLSGWHRMLIRQRADSAAIVALDQGFIFCLATLYGFGPAELRHQRFSSWWGKMYSHCAHQLHAIVWLDGPDDVLLDRIHKRPSFHVIKEMAATESRQFLTQYRSSYEHVISAVCSRGPVEIMKFDTSQESTPSMVAKLNNCWHPTCSSSSVTEMIHSSAET